MAFQITAAKSTRVTKSRSKNPLGNRASASPLKGRRAAASKASKKVSAVADDDDDELFDSRLDDHGLITALATDLGFRDVPQQLQYIEKHMFEAIPDRSGMNSTSIAEVLNFRKNLPPIISVAHVHSLSRSPTATEREIAELVKGGTIRKISIPARGVGSSDIGESLVLTERWKSYVHESGLEDSVKQKYIEALGRYPNSTTVPALYFLPTESSALMAAGFLTSATSVNSSAFFNPGVMSSISTAGSRAAAGSIAAVGGSSAIYDAGGGGSALSMSQQSAPSYGPQLKFSLPSTGVYLRLLESARNHLVSLLSKSKFKEAPKDLLRERWNGGLARTERRERGKGLEGAVLPARTRKWKQYYGLRFEWVLEECLGTGAIEIFETGSVGHGVRLT